MTGLIAKISKCNILNAILLPEKYGYKLSVDWNEGLFTAAGKTRGNNQVQEQFMCVYKNILFGNRSALSMFRNTFRGHPTL